MLLLPEELQLYIADFGQIMYRVNRKNHIQNSKFKIQNSNLIQKEINQPKFLMELPNLN